MDRTGIGGGIETRTGPRKDVWQDYEREFSGSTEGRVRQKDRTSLRTPETGDTRRPEIAVFGLFIGFLGLWYLHIKKEENERKEERKDKK